MKRLRALFKIEIGNLAINAIPRDFDFPPYRNR